MLVVTVMHCAQITPVAKSIGSIASKRFIIGLSIIMFKVPEEYLK